MKSEPQKDQKMDDRTGLKPCTDGIRTATTDDADETIEIDPADFFDPEEFGYRRFQGRFWHDWRP